MSGNSGKKRSMWPWVFLVLNIGAIAFWYFTVGLIPAGELKVLSISPTGSEVFPDNIDHINIEFDSTLNPESVNGESIVLVPPVKGRTELLDGRILRYKLTERLRPATTYRIIWSPKIKGKYGQTIPRELVEFSTTRLAFESAEQASFDRDSYTVAVNFNQPVRASDLDAAIKAEFSIPEGSATREIKVVSTGAARRHLIRIRENRASLILLTLPAGLTGSGPLGLKNDVPLLWSIAGRDSAKREWPKWAEGLEPKELAAKVTFVGMTADWDGTTGVIRVRTTSPIDLTLAKDYVNIEPEVPITFSSDWQGLKIMGPFQPSKQYRVTLKAGLPAGDAETLSESITRQVWFDNLPPRLEFTYGGGYLRPGGLLKVPVRSRNVKKFNVGLRQLYPENIVETVVRDYGYESTDEEYSLPQKKKEIKARGGQDEEVETLLDLRDVADGELSGVYGLEVWQGERSWNRKSAFLVVSNLGMTVRMGNNRLFAWTVALDKAAPASGVKVQVFSNRRHFLGETVTGEDGTAEMELATLPEGESAALALAKMGDEVTFVMLDRGRNSRGEAETSGDNYSGNYQAFLSSERGVYRGGERVILSGMVRDSMMDVPQPLPFDLVLTGPDGKEVRKKRVRSDAAGTMETEIPLADSSPGGLYRIQLRLPGDSKTVGSTTFRIADYLPETLKLTLDLAEQVDPSASYPVRLNVERLAGGDVGELPGKVVATYSPKPFVNPKWDAWRFGDWREGKGGGRETRSYEFVTDEKGNATQALRHPVVATPGAVALSMWIEVREPGGRAVSELAERMIFAAPFYVGIQKETRLPSAGDKVQFSLAAVLPDGGLASPETPWKAQLYRLEYTSLLKRRDDGRLVYEWSSREIPEADVAGGWRDGRAEVEFTPNAGGNYRVLVEAGDGKAASLDFEISGEDADLWAGEDPEKLQLTADRDTYSTDDEAVITMQAPFSGTALVTVEKDHILSRKIIEVKAGENRIPVEVKEEWRPNAYVGVTLVRPVGSEAEWKPHRTSGVIGIKVDNKDRRLNTAISAPEAMRPGKTVDVSVKVEGGGKPAKDAVVYLWGVDEGVLSLTNYGTPSPWDFFYRLRRLGVGDADMFSRLAPELEEWRGGKEPSAGGGSGDFGRRLNPVAATRVRAAVVAAGRLVANEDGVATAKIDVPQLAGRMRFMAWSANGKSMGSAEQSVEVKSPVMLLTSWPRFAAPGDRFTVTATVINRSGRDGVVKLISNAVSGLKISPEEITVPVDNEKSKNVEFQVTAEKVGKAEAVLTAKLSDDEFVDRVEFAVRPPVMFRRSSGIIEVPSGEKREFAAGEEYLPGTGRMKLLVAGNPQVKLTGAMEALLDYPYGCAEQTSSRLAGLIFLPDLLSLSRPGQVESGETNRIIAACLARLGMMQSGNGGFRMWPDMSQPEFWVSAQILYILEEAAAAGVDIPDNMLKSARTYVKERLEYNMDNAMEDGGDNVAMACLALARGGDIRRSWLILLQERAASGEKRLSSAALGYLCEAVALAGDRDEAKRLFDLHGPEGQAAGVVRNKIISHAAWLSAAVLLEQKATAAGLTLALDQELAASYYYWTTRENAFALMSLGKQWRQTRANPSTTVTVKIDGNEHAFPAVKGKAWENLSPSSKVEVAVENGGSAYLFWMAEGVPTTGGAVEEDRGGMWVRRKVFTLDGNELQAPFRLKQGEVYEAVLDFKAKGDDLVLADLLPGGMEIEDAALKGQAAEMAVRGSAAVSQVEIKDDRLLWFGVCNGEGSYRYRVRAVTPGTFVWPAVDGAKMYEPAAHSVGSLGQLVVEKAGNSTTAENK